MISTSGNHDYMSMTTNKYSPEGKGPQKSMWTVCQGSGGKGDIWRGSGWLLEYWLGMRYTCQSFYWQGRLFLETISSHVEVALSLSDLGDWPSCTMEMIYCRYDYASVMKDDDSLSASSCQTCLKRFNSVRSASWNCWGSFSMFLHDWVRVRLAKHCMMWHLVLLLLGFWLAFGTAADARKSTYSSA